MTTFNETITLTFCESGENHVGMEILGEKAPLGKGFDLEDLEGVQSIFEDQGFKTELYPLSYLVELEEVEEAYVLVIRQGVNYFLTEPEEFLQELIGFEWDRKYWDHRRQRVLNKHARSNVCFGSISSEPDYENKKGRVVGYREVPQLNKIKESLSDLLGEKGDNLVCEGNRYFNLEKCGIGFHGDSERRRVIGIRVGQPMNIKWSWFYQSKSQGIPLELTLNDGDIYFMCEKAVGTDWKKRNIYTLRHAAGCSKYLELTK